MWQCPKCERSFKSTNQSHWCLKVDIDDLFEGKPEDLLLTFDKLLVAVADWEPCQVAATRKAIVFSKYKAWMVIHPKTKWLDITFMLPYSRKDDWLHKIQLYGKVHRHIVRVSHENHITEALLKALKESHELSN